MHSGHMQNTFEGKYKTVKSVLGAVEKGVKTADTAMSAIGTCAEIAEKALEFTPQILKIGGALADLAAPLPMAGAAASILGEVLKFVAEPDKKRAVERISKLSLGILNSRYLYN